MIDVLEVYEREYNPKFPVVCLDEKSKQQLMEIRVPIPGKPGKPRRIDYEYKRNGTCNLFVAIEPKANRRIVRVTTHRTKIEYAYFLKYLVTVVYKDAEKIILVEDNLNIHHESSLIAVFGEKEGKAIAAKIEWHYTPKHASWLDQAEIEIHALEVQCLRKRMANKKVVRLEVAACVRRRNREKCGIKWQFTRDKARKKFHLV